MTVYRSIFPFAWVLAVLMPVRLLASPENQIREALHAADLRQTQVAVLAMDLSANKVLASVNADVPMIPASNMKLVTTAGALHVLGPDYIFRTTLRLIEPSDWAAIPDRQMRERGIALDRGPVLIIQGDGDPGFCDPDLLREHQWDVDELLQVWAQAVRDAGVSEVQSLILDDRVFDQQFVHPSWPKQQLNKWYCAQVAGINFYDNCLDIYPIPTESGQSPQIVIFPTTSSIYLINKAVTGKTDSIWLTRESQTNKITVGGTVKHRRTSPLLVTMHDPPMVLGRIFAEHLNNVGVTVHQIDRPDKEDRLPQGKVLHAVQTTMPAVLQRCNKDSQNLFAEALLKRMGREFTGTAGGWDNAAAAVRFFLQDQIGPVGAAVTVADGSGLSRDNRVTARVLVEILHKMYEDERFGPLFLDSLAIGGVDGTLKKRFKKGTKGRVYAKSGYISKVSCLSGYLVSSSSQDGDLTPPRTVAFSLLFNDFKPPVHVYKIKRTQDSVIKILDQYLSTAQSVQPARSEP